MYAYYLRELSITSNIITIYVICFAHGPNAKEYKLRLLIH